MHSRQSSLPQMYQAWVFVHAMSPFNIYLIVVEPQALVISQTCLNPFLVFAWIQYDQLMTTEIPGNFDLACGALAVVPTAVSDG